MISSNPHGIDTAVRNAARPFEGKGAVARGEDRARLDADLTRGDPDCGAGLQALEGRDSKSPRHVRADVLRLLSGRRRLSPEGNAEQEEERKARTHGVLRVQDCGCGWRMASSRSKIESVQLRAMMLVASRRLLTTRTAIGPSAVV